MKYKTELISKEVVAEGTFAFHFKRPEGFEWRAGQSMDVTLIDPPETDGNNTHAFSIVSAPHEETLTIATRLRGSAYKRVLETADSGLEVEIEGPFGSFTLHENESRAAIMLVGGIGITPFISMIKDATHKNCRTPFICSTLTAGQKTPCTSRSFARLLRKMSISPLSVR